MNTPVKTARLLVYSSTCLFVHSGNSWGKICISFAANDIIIVYLCQNIAES